MIVAGVDEAGRGPLAGPVVAAAIVLPPGYENIEIKDSKKLTKAKRSKLYQEIKKIALDYSIVAVGHKRIDKLNIREASKLAMSLAVKKIKAEKVLVDGNMQINITIPQETIIGGDNSHIQISAASILAKVYRDNLMTSLDQKYPGYDFKIHAGYPTKIHRENIKKLGLSPVHRKSFRVS